WNWTAAEFPLWARFARCRRCSRRSDRRLPRSGPRYDRIEGPSGSPAPSSGERLSAVQCARLAANREGPFAERSEFALPARGWYSWRVLSAPEGMGVNKQRSYRERERKPFGRTAFVND